MIIKCDKYDLIFDRDSLYYSSGELLILNKYIKSITVVRHSKYIHGLITIYYYDPINMVNNEYSFSYSGEETYRIACKFERLINREHYDNYLEDINIESILEGLLETEEYESNVISNKIVENNKELSFVFKRYNLIIRDYFISIVPGSICFHISLIDRFIVKEPKKFNQGSLCIILKQCSTINKSFLFVFDDIDLYYELVSFQANIDLSWTDFNNEIEMFHMKNSKRLELSFDYLDEINTDFFESLNSIEREVIKQEKSVLYSKFIDINKFNNIEEYNIYVEELKKRNRKGRFNNA